MKNSHQPLLILSMISLWPTVGMGSAPNPNAKAGGYALPPITVTAPRFNTEASSVSTILSQDDLKQTGKPFLRQVLEQSPGVVVTDQSAPSLRLRGSAPRHSPVVFDGISTLDSSSIDGSFDYNTLPTAALKSVRVIKGPQGVLYGDGAVSGIIDITTLTPEIEPGTSATLKNEFGSFYTRRTQADLHHGKETYHLDLTAHSFTCDGPAYRKNFHNALLTGTALYRLSDQVQMSTHLQGQRTIGKLLFGNDKHFRINQLFFIHKTQFTGLSDHLVQSLSFSHNTTDRFYTASPTDDHFRGRTSHLLYRALYTATSKATFQWGLDGRRHKGDIHASFGGKLHRSSNLLGIYAQSAYKITPALQIDIGTRVDKHTDFHDLWNFRSGVTYTLSNTLLYTSYGTGHKSPSYYQRFDPQYGTPHLKRERSFGFDSGFTHRAFKDKVIVDANLFHTHLTNYLDFKWSPHGHSQYVQQGNITLQGAELSITTFPSSTLDVTGTYTFTHTKGLALNPVPQHFGTLTASWSPTAKLFLAPSLRLSGSAKTGLGPVSGFGVVDLNTRYALSPWAAFTCRLDNLFNKRYTQIPGQIPPGFSIYSGMEISI